MPLSLDPDPRNAWRAWPLADADVRDTLITSGVTITLAVALLRNARAQQQVRARAWPAGAPAPFVSVIVPMRDEVANVDGCLAALCAQRYPAFEVVAVDDGSTDGTGAALARWAGRDPRVRVTPGAPLPAGWTGKNWALQQGLGACDPRAVWALTLDADMRCDPPALASAVAYAEAQGADMLTLLPRLELGSFWERLLVPHAGEMYSLLVGFMSRINAPESAVAAANGQFILLRRAVYDALGGQAAVRAEVAEDWALARLVKAAGYRLIMAQGRDILQARVYASFGALWRGYAKTLFPATGRSLPRVALTVAALTSYGLLPPGRLARDTWALARGRDPDAPRRVRLGLAQVAPLLALRMALARYLGVSPLYALAYPLAVLLGDGMLLWSAYRYLSGRGMSWKGREYG